MSQKVFSRPCLCLISTTYHRTFSLKKQHFCIVCLASLSFSFPDPLQCHCHLTSLNLSLPVSELYILFWRGLSKKTYKNVWRWKFRNCCVPVNTLLGPLPGPWKGPLPNLSIITFTINLPLCPVVLHHVSFHPKKSGRILSGWVEGSSPGLSHACLESTAWVHPALAAQVSVQNLNLIMSQPHVNFPIPQYLKDKPKFLKGVRGPQEGASPCVTDPGSWTL